MIYQGICRLIYADLLAVIVGDYAGDADDVLVVAQASFAGFHVAEAGAFEPVQVLFAFGVAGLDFFGELFQRVEYLFLFEACGVVVEERYCDWVHGLLHELSG